MAQLVKCSGCGFTGESSEFRMGHDFFQNPYIAGCPKCKNSQSPGDASMRMFGGERPFVFVNKVSIGDDPLSKTLDRANEAS